MNKTNKISDLINPLGAWLLTVLSELKNHFIAVLLILVLFIMFWFLPQTNDLLLILNQPSNHGWEVFFFFSSLTVFAFLISNLNDYLNPDAGTPRIIPMDSLEKKIHKNQDVKPFFDESERHYVKRALPKALGTSLILVTAFAVNHTFYEIKGVYIFGIHDGYGLLFCLLLLLFSMHQRLSQWLSGLLRKVDPKERFPIVIAVISLAVIVFMGFFNQGGSNADIKRLFVVLMLLALFFFIVSMSYSKSILWLKAKIGIYAIGFLTIAAFILYIAFFVNPSYAKNFNPLLVINISFISIFTFCTVIRFVGGLAGIPLLPIVFLIMLLLSLRTAGNPNFKHYEVSSVAVDSTSKERMQVKAHIRTWLSDRKDSICNSNKNSRYPIIFVSAEGGGSRAGLWSFLVHSYLYERNPDYFNKYLFSLTGASEGNVGNAMFFAMANRNRMAEERNVFTNQANGHRQGFRYKASSFFANNFLSSSLAALLGRDFMQSVTGLFVFDDRAALLEKEWEETYSAVFEHHNLLEAPFLSIKPLPVQGKTISPLLLINTAHLQSGEYSLIAPIRFNDDLENLGVFRDFLTNFDMVVRDSTIKLSTAMLLNARFPYINPVGKVRGDGQYADAGYYDNIGGTVTRRLKQTFKDVLQTEFPEMVQKIEIKELVITNKENRIHSKEQSPDSVKYSSQLEAPLKLLLSATFGHPVEEKKKRKGKVIIESMITKIPMNSGTAGFDGVYLGSDKNDSIRPILPLGRYLSNGAIRSLEARLMNDSVCRQLDELVPCKR